MQHWRNNVTVEFSNRFYVNASFQCLHFAESKVSVVAASEKREGKGVIDVYLGLSLITAEGFVSQSVSVG